MGEIPSGEGYEYNNPFHQEAVPERAEPAEQAKPLSEQYYDRALLSYRISENVKSGLDSMPHLKDLAYDVGQDSSAVRLKPFIDKQVERLEQSGPALRESLQSTMPLQIPTFGEGRITVGQEVVASDEAGCFNYYRELFNTTTGVLDSYRDTCRQVVDVAVALRAATTKSEVLDALSAVEQNLGIQEVNIKIGDDFDYKTMEVFANDEPVNDPSLEGKVIPYSSVGPQDAGTAYRLNRNFSLREFGFEEEQKDTLEAHSTLRKALVAIGKYTPPTK